MNRFNRPRLIGFDDPAYQRHVEEMKLQRANQRAIRPPTQRDLFGGEVETVLRSALEPRFTLADRRILEYEERKGRAWQRKYRELDAVALDGHTRVHVFEIKASRRVGALHRALRQLRDTEAILRLAFRHVSTTVLVVDTGMITAEERDELAKELHPDDRLPQTLPEALEAYPDLRRVDAIEELSAFPDRIELLVLSLNQLIDMAGDMPLSLDWDADEEEDEPAPPPPSGPLYSTADDADADESPLAAALRRAQGGNSSR